MSALVIDVRAGRQLTHIPLAVDVLDGEMNTVWSGSVMLGSEATVELAPGRYAIQARMPSGETMTKTCALEPTGQSSVVFEPTLGSPRESLEWTKLSEPGARRTVDAPDPMESSRQDFTEADLSSIWLRLWGRPDGGPWRVLRWPASPPEREPGLVQHDFSFRSAQQFALYYLQLGGPSTRWRLVALPADDIRVLITPRPGSEPSSRSLAVTVASVDYRGDALLGYMRQGDIARAHGVARSMLSGKVENPTAAAVAAYFFLRTSKFEEFRQWMTNLATWMRWLPDGAVIDAWALLRSARPDPVRARQRLLEAASRGIPVFTTGLRLLIDGLTMLAKDKTLKTPEVIHALKTARRYGAAAEWGAPTTTFRGVDPLTPGTMQGMPRVLSDVVFLDGSPALPSQAPGVVAAPPSPRRKTAALRRRTSVPLVGAAASAPSEFQFSTVESPGPDCDEPVEISEAHPLAEMVGKGVLSSGVIARRLLSYANDVSRKPTSSKAQALRPALQAALRTSTQLAGTALVNHVMDLLSNPAPSSEPASRPPSSPGPSP